MILPVDEAIVNQASKDTTTKGCDERDPGIETLTGEDLESPAGKGREQARPKVASRVEGVSGLEAKRSADGEEGEAKDDWCAIFGGEIVLVASGQDDEKEHKGADKLGNKGAHGAHVRLRVCGKDTGGYVVEAAKV